MFLIHLVEIIKEYVGQILKYKFGGSCAISNMAW